MNSYQTVYIQGGWAVAWANGTELGIIAEGFSSEADANVQSQKLGLGSSAVVVAKLVAPA